MQVGTCSKESQVQSEMVYILEQLPKKESGEESGLAVASKSVSKKSASFVVNFPEPLPMCRDDQNRVDWILGIFTQEFERLAVEFGDGLPRIPTKPYDVGELYDKVGAIKSLTKLAEAFYVMYGERPGMMLTRDTGEARREISLVDVNEFAVLNLLSVIRATLQTVEFPNSVFEQAGLLVELPMGNTKYSYATDGASEFVVKGGSFDIGRFWMPGGMEGEGDIDLGTQHKKKSFKKKDERN